MLQATGSAVALAITAVLASRGAHADCTLELELLGTELRQVRITQLQGQQLAPFVEDALRYCRTGHDALAVQAIDKARTIAHITRRDPLDEAPAEPADTRR